MHSLQTSVSGDISINDFQIFHNPTSEILWVESLTQQIETVSLFDAQGRQVLTLDYDAAQGINLSEFSTGMYFLKIANESGAVTKKIVVE